MNRTRMVKIISCAAILTSELEVQKKESSTDRPPILPAPAQDVLRAGGVQ